ncbi:MAG: hypothetical protein IH587_10855 [Anaerolineae bacterium]|nr:hypothetical protein [Anaerolineae bacterium]
MPVTTNWYVPNAVIYTRFSGEPTEDDIVSNSHAINVMVAESDRPRVHVLTDFTAVTTATPLAVILRASKFTRPHERIGWVITIGEQDPVIKLMAKIARQLVHLKTRGVDTVEDAIDILKSLDDTIDWSQARGEVLTSGSS